MKTKVGELVLRKVHGEQRWKASFDCQRRWYFAPDPEVAIMLACKALAYTEGARANAYYHMPGAEPVRLPDLSSLATVQVAHSV